MNTLIECEPLGVGEIGTVKSYGERRCTSRLESNSQFVTGVSNFSLPSETEPFQH